MTDLNNEIEEIDEIKGVRVTKDNIQEVIESMTKEDAEYIMKNNIRTFTATGAIGKRFKHYFEVMKFCEHTHTTRNSYPRRSGDSYFTVCSDCGQSWLE